MAGVAQVSGPLRSCRICRAQGPKIQLIRWVWQGQWHQDDTQTKPGRGYYACGPECEQRLMKTKPKRK